MFQVKLKCIEGASKGSVSMFLLEPQSCHYILGVESPLICQLLHKLDDTGLIPLDQPVLQEDDEMVMTDIED